MAKLEVLAQDVKQTISDLRLYRSGWANDICEGWNCSIDGAQEITFTLYEVSGSIILSLQAVLAGNFRDKMALYLVKRKLENLVNSDNFKKFDGLGKIHACNVVTTGTKHHIRVMMETLEVLTA